MSVKGLCVKNANEGERIAKEETLLSLPSYSEKVYYLSHLSKREKVFRTRYFNLERNLYYALLTKNHCASTVCSIAAIKFFIFSLR